MSKKDAQKEYEEQNEKVSLGDLETVKTGKKCCCDYIKWSFKAACKMFDCITQCA